MTHAERAPLLSQLRPLYNKDEDANRFERRVLFINALLFLHLGIVAAGLLAPWTFLLTMPSLFVRWLSTIHEISHLRGPENVSPLVRISLLLTGPLTAGYRELRVEHMLHHKHALDDEDPTLYLVAGNNLRGGLASLTAPEQLLFRWIAVNGIDRLLLIECAVRLGSFVVAFWLLGGVFVWYWIVLRISYAAAFFAFFRAIHRRGEEIGNFEIDLPKPLAMAFVVVFGREAANAILYHDIHHSHAMISASKLQDASLLLR